MELTFEFILAVARLGLFAGAGIAMLSSALAKEDSKITRYNTEAILCYILASGI